MEANDPSITRPECNRLEVMEVNKDVEPREEVEIMELMQEVAVITVDSGGAKSVWPSGESGSRKRKCHPCGGRREKGICWRRQDVQHEVLGRGRQTTTGVG